MLRLVVLAVVACYMGAEAGQIYGNAYGRNAYGGNVYGAHGGGFRTYGYLEKALPNNGYEADINKNSALRQLGVNRNAQRAGSGSGTARLDGVPGTVLGRTGYGGYGKGGYGYAGYANAGYAGYAGKGVALGHAGYGNLGYGGVAGYANNHAAYAKGNLGYPVKGAFRGFGGY